MCIITLQPFANGRQNFSSPASGVSFSIFLISKKEHGKIKEYFQDLVLTRFCVKSGKS